MIISTRGRYALRVMIDLAENGGGDYIPMKTIAERQGISLKYLERILPVLTRNGIVEGQQGKGGGYRLTRAPEEYGVGEILRLTEGDLSPVSCMACGAEPCRQRCRCKTYPLWAGLQATIDRYLDNITLAALVAEEL
ncbi:MAG: RrF2 family transcriptional regulator [Ruminococcaceae bacterium]|nr:RrF2 family transcriptional regulator [Oscillospiraceae bacterium]